MEMSQTLDGIMFANMLRAGAMNLRTHAQTINDLIVFPIPDGDTGSNMMLTIMGGIDALNNEYSSVAEAARLAANGMLLSARGNSGVILSQLFDGIAAGFDGIETADNTQIAHAMRRGVTYAYNAVMQPTEGTMLTVAKNAAEYAGSKTSETIEQFFDAYIAEAKRTLDKTPELLPVLKKAGVVDSGGAGLVYIVEGMKKAINNEIDITELNATAEVPTNSDIDIDLFTEDSILEYGYCTELLLRLQRSKTEPESFNVDIITDYLNKIGDSVVAFKTGSIIKIHVHTMTPDKVLAFCQKYGEFLTLKIENMSLQHNSLNKERSADSLTETGKKDYGIVAVCSGDGIKRLFTERGADYIVDGGQSMNPSTEDFLEAFRAVNAKTIFVLPNNGNIILSAQQAAKLYTAADVRVLESKTIGDGYAALSMLDTQSENTEEIINELNEAMSSTVTAEVSRCIRDAEFQNIEMHIGDYVGFAGKNFLATSKSRIDTVCATVDKLSFADYDICLLIRGSKTTSEEAEKIKAAISLRYPNKEIYIIDGMQEIYDYIIILE